ncbi:MAG: hypothetical protein AAGM67_02025, partial [Bacteroidota bacterium]
PPSTPAQNTKFDERKEALLVLDSLPNLRERGSFFRGAKLFWITESQSRETQRLASDIDPEVSNVPLSFHFDT